MTTPLVYGHQSFDDHEVRAMTTKPEPLSAEDITNVEEVLVSQEQHGRTLTLVPTDVLRRLLDAARAEATPSLSRTRLRTASDAIAYVRERVRLDSQAPDGRAWPGEIDDILDDAAALAETQETWR